MSHPICSPVQAYVYRSLCQPFGSYADETLVGYVMVIYDRDIPEDDIRHMMIDAGQQGGGYGRAVMQACLRYIRTKPFDPVDRLCLTCDRENEAALRLYTGLGFVSAVWSTMRSSNRSVIRYRTAAGDRLHDSRSPVFNRRYISNFARSLDMMCL